MIPLLPYRQFDLVSPRPVRDVAEALGEEVEPRRWTRSSAGRRRFEGTVTETTFEIARVISYRNSFLPRVRGTLASEGSGTRISITMGLHPGTLWFMAVWLGIVFLGGIGYTASAVNEGGPFAAASLPAGMFLFGWAITLGGFWFEAHQAERMLCSITGGSRATPP